MEKEERNIPRTTNSPAPVESKFLLRWGSRKRLRSCVRFRGNNNPAEISSSSTIRSGFLALEAPFPQSDPRRTRPNSELASVGSEESGRITRVDAVAGEQGMDHHEEKKKNMKIVCPKLCIGLSSKEKEEDFMAMKGCKLPQRPKKRAKFIQRTLLLASPGLWLTDMSLERYQVREKKKCKKRTRGLKAMGSIIESDSE